MASKPELVYFNGRGRGEIIRLVLTAAGIEFTEKNVNTRDEFLALLPDLLLNQLPLLRINGRNLVQSSSTARHVARIGNLLGEKEPEITSVDIIYEGSRDYLDAVFMPIGFNIDEKDIGERKPTVIKYLTLFNKILKENDTGYFVGSSLTLADLGILETILATVDYFGKEVLNDYPEVLNFYKTVTSLERISKYIKEVRKPRNSSEYVATVNRVLAR